MNTTRCSTCGVTHTHEVLEVVEFPLLKLSVSVARNELGSFSLVDKWDNGSVLVHGHWEHSNEALQHAKGYAERCAADMLRYLGYRGSF